MVAGEARVKDHILLYLSLTSKLFYQLWARCCGLTGFHRYVAPVILISGAWFKIEPRLNFVFDLNLLKCASSPRRKLA